MRRRRAGKTSGLEASRARALPRLALACAALPACTGIAVAQPASESVLPFTPASLSFELVDANGAPRGVTLGNGAAIENGVAADGERSLRLAAGDGREARATLRIPAPEIDGNRIRFSMRARGADGADAIDVLVRIDGPNGLLYVDRRRASIADADDAGWASVEIETPVFAAASSVRLNLAIERGTAWIDAIAIDGASTASRPPASAAARRYVEYVLDLIDSHSIYRASLDWPRFRADVLEQARGAATAEDAHLAVRYALGALGDVHGYLRASDRAEALGRAPVSNARTARPPIPPDGRTLPGGIGYVTIPGFAGGTHMQQVEFAEGLQSLLRSLDDEAGGACGWIVDLRRNSGGNLWPMLLGIGPLVGDGDAVIATYPDGRRDTVWYRDGKAGLGDYARLRVRGEPYRPRRADARVAILLGPDTASAGEVLAMAFRGVDGRRSFGAPTDGVNTGTRTFELPDGAELVLAVVTMSDRTGRVYRGPMEPDISAAPGPRDAPLLEQPDVRAALDFAAEAC